MPSRSTVSSKVVGGRTGLNTASSAASRSIPQDSFGSCMIPPLGWTIQSLRA